MPSLFFITMQVWTNYDKDGPVNSYDYDIIEHDHIEIFRSESREWTTPNEKVGELKDDGESISITIEGKKIKLNYGQEVVLLALLMYHYQDKLELREPQIFKSI